MPLSVVPWCLWPTMPCICPWLSPRSLTQLPFRCSLSARHKHLYARKHGIFKCPFYCHCAPRDASATWIPSPSDGFPSKHQRIGLGIDGRQYHAHSGGGIGYTDDIAPDRLEPSSCTSQRWCLHLLSSGRTGLYHVPQCPEEAEGEALRSQAQSMFFVTTKCRKCCQMQERPQDTEAESRQGCAETGPKGSLQEDYTCRAPAGVDSRAFCFIDLIYCFI